MPYSKFFLKKRNVGTGKPNLIAEKSFAFALELIEYSELLRSRRKYEMSSQLFRSGTSIGANISEAQNAESKADFVHKFKIAAKEGEETRFWLKLCLSSEYYPNPPKIILKEIDEIMLVLSKIIGSAKRNSRKSR